MWDFQRYLGINALDVLAESPTLTPRMFLRYLAQLPDDSAAVAEFRGGAEYRGWGTDRHLLVTLLDAMNGLLWLTANKDVPKNKRKPVPELIERPGGVPKPKSQHAGLFRAQAMAHLEKVKGLQNGGGR